MDSFAEILQDLIKPFEPFKTLLPRSVCPIQETELTLESFSEHVVVSGRWSHVERLSPFQFPADKA
jgi:hypothetical protein